MELASGNASMTGTRELVERIRQAASQFHIVSLNRQIEVCEGLARENPIIDVAILGQFKAGKSSFINSLIGESILPVGVIPVTTVITRIASGSRQSAYLTYSDGAREEIEIGKLDEYISEAKNPSNEKNVNFVDIELPSLEAFPGIRLVDTPGLGSVFKYHMKVSENWLPEVGAAILAISADRPLSDHDLNLIEDLTHYTPRIVILLTKADLLTTGQQNEVVQFFRQTLKRELNRELPIYLYSDRLDTECFRQRIEGELLYELSSNRNQEFRRILTYKTQSLLRGCISYLDVALKTSLESDHDREALRAKILSEKVNYDHIREELSVIARENQRQTRPLLKKHLDRFQRPLTEKITKKLSEELPVWKGNLWKLTRRYEAWIGDVMAEEIAYISRTENKHFYGTLDRAYTSLTRYLESFKVLLNENIQKVLGVRLSESEWDIDVVEPESPDIRILYSFDIHLDLIWFLIPMVIFRRFFERHFLREVPWTVEVNLSRLAAQWETRINKAIDEMKNQTLQYIENELATIDSMLSKTQGQTEEIRDTIRGLRRYQTIL